MFANELASGADLAAVATKYNLKPITVAAVDATAKDPAGNVVWPCCRSRPPKC